MTRVAVVGAAAGGPATAVGLRRQGFDGLITMIGEEPHLPYDRPPLSKQILTGQWGPEHLPLRPESDIDALDLDLRLGMAATAVDQAARTVTPADGSSVPYDAPIIATGVRPRPFTGEPGGPGVHVPRTQEDAVALRDRLSSGRRLVVIGGGFVGTEVAAAARQRGVDVTVVESEAQPSARIIGREAGRFITGIHRERGVRILTRVKAAGLDAAGDIVSGTRLEDGRLLSADDVLVATGSLPNTDWPRGSGLDIGDGLVCDAYGRCAPGVHAVGDGARWFNPLFGCAMRVEHRTTASEQGIAVARNLLNPATPQPFAHVSYFWTDQYEVKVQSHGYLLGHEESAVLDGDLAERRALIGYRRGRHLAGVLAIGMPFKAVRAWRTAEEPAAPSGLPQHLHRQPSDKRRIHAPPRPRHPLTALPPGTAVRVPVRPTPGLPELAAARRTAARHAVERLHRLGGDPLRGHPHRPERPACQRRRPQPRHAPPLTGRRGQDGPRAPFVRLDDPEHARQRRMLTRDFTAEHAAALRPQVRQLVDETLDEMVRKGPPADLLTDFALPVPSRVIAVLLGVPYDDHAFFQDCSNKLLDMSLPAEAVRTTAEAFGAYLYSLVNSKATDPGEDLLSRLLAERVDTGELTRQHLVSMALLMLIAAHETTANTIALGTLALLRRPEQLALLRDTEDPAVVARAVEELLRYLWSSRTSSCASPPRTSRSPENTSGPATGSSSASPTRDPATCRIPTPPAPPHLNEAPH